jgi:hypothetical protein
MRLVKPWALQAAEKLKAEGDGGFNPRAKPNKSTMALATEERFSPVLLENPSFSAASLAPAGMHLALRTSFLKHIPRNRKAQTPTGEAILVLS